MSLSPTIYSSADSGAPVLTGEAGKLLALLRAILVSGYGVKSGLGWTEPFSGSGKAAFRNNPVSGTGYHIRVEDTGTRVGLMTGYLGMTDVDTGDGNPVPTVAQYSTGMPWAKSSVTTSTARDWIAIGNERSVYLFVDVYGTGNLYPNFVGDIDSLLAGDAHHFFLSSSGLAANWSGSTGSGVYVSVLFRTAVTAWNAAMSSLSSTISGYFARNRAQSAGAVTGDHPASEYGVAGAPGSAGLSYPFAGRLLHSPIVVRDGASSVRGVMPGVLGPIHNRPLIHLATLPGVPGTPPGSELLAVDFRIFTSGAIDGQVLFITGADW